MEEVHTSKCHVPEKENPCTREIHVLEYGVVVVQTRSESGLRLMTMGRQSSRAAGEHVVFERRPRRGGEPRQARGLVQRFSPRAKAVRARVQGEHVRHGVAGVKNAVRPPLADGALEAAFARVPTSLARTRDSRRETVLQTWIPRVERNNAHTLQMVSPSEYSTSSLLSI